MTHTRFLSVPVVATIALALGLGAALEPTAAAPAVAMDEAATDQQTVILVPDTVTTEDPAPTDDVVALPAPVAVLPADDPASAPPAGAADDELSDHDDVVIALPPVVTAQPSATFLPTTCTAPGTYTLGADDQVVWLVDGAETLPGTHSAVAGRTVLVEATPYLGSFSAGILTEWTFTFDMPTSCESAGDGAIQPVAPPVVPIAEVPAATPIPDAPALPSAVPPVPPVTSPSITPAPTATRSLAQPGAIASSGSSRREQAPFTGELPTLAFTGSSDRTDVVGAVGMLLLISGLGMVLLRRATPQ